MSKKVVLISSDREKFVVDKEAAAMSVTVRDLMEDIDEGDDIPIPNVQGKILAKVIEFCNKHAKAAPEGEGESSSAESEELKAWDAEFCNVDQGTLFELILAANYLNIKPLLDLTCMTVANMIKGKSPEEIRETFNIENDFTPEEEEEVRRENQWAFE